jgi:hypothetical protein
MSSPPSFEVQTWKVLGELAELRRSIAVQDVGRKKGDCEAGAQYMPFCHKASSDPRDSCCSISPATTVRARCRMSPEGVGVRVMELWLPGRLVASRIARVFSTTQPQRLRIEILIYSDTSLGISYTSVAS